MSKREFLTLADALAIHAILIKKYGGFEGVRDMGALESALYRPQTGYYLDLIQEAAALLESLAINHPFIDGNKRSASGDDIYSKIIELFDSGEFRLDVIERWIRENVKPKTL